MEARTPLEMATGYLIPTRVKEYFSEIVALKKTSADKLGEGEHPGE